MSLRQSILRGQGVHPDGDLAGVLIGVLRPAWYWAIALAVLCVLAVFGAIIWWESRAEPNAAPDREGK